MLRRFCYLPQSAVPYDFWVGRHRGLAGTFIRGVRIWRIIWWISKSADRGSKRVMQAASLALIGAFLFPARVSGGGTRQPYRGRPLLLSAVAGLGFAALGWMAGGFAGSWAPRTVCAVGATAIALGWLNRQPRAALLGAVSAAIVSLVAVQVGQSYFSPVLAWPVAGLVIGVAGAFAYRRRRAKIAFIVAAPLLGSVGVAAGMLAVFLTAWGLNDSRVAAQIMLGGAAGFGLLVMAGAALAGRWLDGSRAAGGAS